MDSSIQMGLIAGQPVVHPVLEQIEQLNAKYGSQTVLGQLLQPQTVDISDQDEIGKMRDDGVHEAVSSEVFSLYEHRDIVPGCQPHPGDIVEAGPLAALSLPEATYPLVDSLPTEIIEQGKLSSLQLEGVLYACQRHQMVLPDGQRAGFFIGDAAGVGKGRQIAGIILDNYARGRTKHIWFTISSDLIVDSRRDLNDIGCYVKVIDGCQELDRETRVLGLPSDFKEGVVFSTYATLVSSVQKGSAISGSKKSRLQQLVDWCGGDDFDGCLIFDECHKAKHFVPGKEHTSTKVAVAVTSIQRMLPKARVVYCSATGVSDVKNMAFMERLGLWGDGAPFKSFEQFLDSVQRKGLGMAEMVAMEMKTSGMYVSRGLSFKQAEFTTVEAPLTKEQKKVYDVAAHVWNELRKALESAVVRTNFNGGRIWQQFWSSHQRFFKQLCIGMKVPTIIKETQEALDNGHCVVIGLQTTGEASLDSEMGKNRGNITGFVSLCREILTRFISQYFPVMIESKSGEEPIADDWSVKAKELLLGFAKQITLPDSPLDEIIDKLGGPSFVAEMTGRRGRIVRHSPNDTPHYEPRAIDADAYGCIESLNVNERNQFMEGKKYVAIISDAASTGISLHADTRARNQRRRVHLTVELPWSADKAVQQLGRSHRSNQSSGPLYKLLTTDLGGERRFAAAVARRLQSLGALTKGDRRAATGADLTEFNFDTPYGRNSLRTMYHNICFKQMVPGISLNKIVGDQYSFEEFNLIMQECLVLMGLIEADTLRSGAQLQDKDTGAISKFLNRIFGLSVAKQNMIFTYFMECLNQTVENAKNEGRYNEGMLDITASSVKMIGESRTVFTDLTKGHGTTRLVELEIDRGMSWEAAMVRHQNHTGEHNGFYKSRREMWGKTLYVLATLKENSTHMFRVTRPNTGLSQFEEEKADLFQRYVPVSPEKAEEGWREQYERTKNQCMHGAGCKTGRSCRVGSRCYRLHLLCGSIVTLMAVLESTLNRFSSKLNLRGSELAWKKRHHSMKLSKSEATIRVVRVKQDNGERVVGIRYPQVLIPEVEKVLIEQNAIEKLQLSQTNLSQSQSGEVLAVVNDVQDTVKNVMIETVTSVNKKCLSRALRPPITIKNFFKPANQIEHFKPCTSQKTSVIDSETSPQEGSSTVTEDVLEKSKTVVIIDSDSNSKDLFERKDNSCETDTKSVNKKNGNLGLTSIKSKKRPAEDLGNSKSSKRAKQATIFYSFAKVEADKKEKEKKAASCPICGTEFKLGTLNSELNSHIDNCLIE